MTDAGVNHHFGTRDRLLEALLRHGGRTIRAGVAEVLGSWLDRGADLGELVDALAAFYRRGYGELAVALHAAGWRDDGSGMLDPVVDALHALRPDAADIPVEDTRLAVAALHQALATESLYGPAFRRSAGLTGRAATTPAPQLRWWTTHLTRSSASGSARPSPAASRSEISGAEDCGVRAGRPWSSRPSLDHQDGR